MNPIYKFTLAANGGIEQQAFPVYRDDLAKDFELQTNQEFYRAKLSGKLTFVSEDYNFIVSQSFDTQFDVKIYISYDGGTTWAEYWHGQFWKTNCKFDADNRNVTLAPDVVDQYTNILAGMEKEFNLIDLAPEIVPVNLDKRPMIQVYVPGQSVIGCFLSGMWWEQGCTSESDVSKLTETGDGKPNFYLNRGFGQIDVTKKLDGAPQDVPDVFWGWLQFNPEFNFEYTAGGYKFIYTRSSAECKIVRISDGATWQKYQMPQDPSSFQLTALSSTGATGIIEVYLHNVRVLARYVTDVNTNTFQMPTDDIVGDNRNYSRVYGYYEPDKIVISSELSTTPTQWGIYKPGQYYVMPSTQSVPEPKPIARAAWSAVSIWFAIGEWSSEQNLRKQYTLRDSYPLASVISVLLAQIAPELTHEETTEYSQFLYGTNPLMGIDQRILITPKSNVISLGYDQPAQKAPITLKRVFDMLRDCFRCYWYIDGDNKLHIEHILYFLRGGSYSGTPVIDRDLTTEISPRNGKPWAFGTSKFQYDKPEMASRYQFGWMDDVTQLFDGNPLEIISKYVNPGNVEQVDVSQFTSDIDYILLSPGEVSKDGFVLLAAVPDDTVFNKYLDASGNEVNNDSWNISPYIPVSGGDSIEWFTGAGSNVGSLIEYDSNKQYLDYWTPNVGSSRTVQLSANAAFVRISYANTNYLAYANVNGSNVFSASGTKFKLPYVNFNLNGVTYTLQNAYVAFIYLQQYYFWDMPARYFKYNGQQRAANGIKKLMTQTLKFPAFTDPKTLELIKTYLGNGTIQKMSVNLSSRTANTTLKYDTE